MQAPGGPAPQGQSFGQNTGGYNYVQNQFAQRPSGAMSFGGGNMAPPVGMSGPRDALAQMQPPPQPQMQQNPQMQHQMMRIGAIRGSAV